MIKITRYRCILALKFSESFFHSMIRCWLPNKLYFIGIVSLRRSNIRKQLQTHFLISSNFDNNTLRTPFILICNLELISREKTCIIILPTSKHKIGIPFFILRAHIKGYLHIVLCLTFFYFFIGFCLFRY